MLSFGTHTNSLPLRESSVGRGVGFELGVGSSP